MSIAFLVLCTKSPTRALPKHKAVRWNKTGVGKLGGYKLSRRKPTGEDSLPDKNWKKRIVDIIEVHGEPKGSRDREKLVNWLERIAFATHGAIYDGDAKEFSYLRQIDATARTKKLLAAGELEVLASWIRCAAPDPYEYQSHRWDTVDAIRKVMQPALARPRKKPLDPTQLCAIAIALHNVYDHEKKLADLVISMAASSTDRQHARIAEAIVEKREEEADMMAETPESSEELTALFAGVATGSKSSQRRIDRFVRESHEEMCDLAIAAIVDGYDPLPKVAALVVAELPIARLTQTQRERLLETGRDSRLAQTLRDAVQTYVDGRPQRGAELSRSRYEEYLRYRDDPLVASPRSRGLDLAMFRGLNDALYGQARDRPRLPEAVAALLGKRKIEDARAAYIDACGAGRADEALCDAIEYFAPDVD